MVIWVSSDGMRRRHAAEFGGAFKPFRLLSLGHRPLTGTKSIAVSWNQMLDNLPSDLSFERVKAAKRRVEEAKRRVAEDMRVHRDAKRELLRLLAMHRERRTDAALQKVEQALASFTETNERADLM